MSHSVEPEESMTDLALTEQPLPELEAQSTQLPDDDHAPRERSEDSDVDTKPYPYPIYNNEVDAESHVRAFLTT